MNGRRASVWAYWGGGPNPLANDLTLFDAYMAALDAAFAEPEIVIALDEFGIAAARLRTEMVSNAERVLRTAAPEFAAYEEALARDAVAMGINPQSVTYGSRRDARSLERLFVRIFTTLGGLLLAGGLASTWFWYAGPSMLGAGATLLAAAGVLVGLRWAAGTQYGRMVVEGIERSDDSFELKLARRRLILAVSQTELLAAIRNFINTARRKRFDFEYMVSSSPGLSEVYDGANWVSTAMSGELNDLLHRLNGGSIGVAGPRGSGKSMLVRQYCEEVREDPSRQDDELFGGLLSPRPPIVEPQNLRCMVAAPVDYAAHDFVLHLFATLARTVIGSYGPRPPLLEGANDVVAWLRFTGRLIGSLLIRVVVFGGAAAALLYWADAVASGLAISASWVRDIAFALIGLGLAGWIWSCRRTLMRWLQGEAHPELVAIAKSQLAKVRYLQTYTSGLSGGVSLPAGIMAQLSRGVSRVEQPLSYPEIVDEFRRFAGTVAAAARRQGGHVYLGVDELDKIGSAEQAERFLNEIKGIFGITGVYFMVSVSDDALTAFERRGLPLRDAFDSSFDEIVHVGPLTYSESRRLLYRRVVGLSEPYVALCHCLAGGLARDLIRAARNTIRAAAKLAGPDDGSADSNSSEDSDEFLLRTSFPDRPRLTIGTIAEYVIREELRRKIRATSHLAESLKSHDTAELQEQFYETADRLALGEPISAAINALFKADAPESASTANLRLDIAAYAYLAGTLSEVFTDHLTAEQILAATSEPANAGSFEILASARNALRRDAMLAWHLTSAFRASWELGTVSPPEQPGHD